MMSGNWHQSVEVSARIAAKHRSLGRAGSTDNFKAQLPRNLAPSTDPAVAEAEEVFEEEEPEWVRRLREKEVSDPGSLDTLTRHIGDITLLDVRWLLRLGRQEGDAARFGGILPAWQCLPPEAFAREAHMRAFDRFANMIGCLALSYPWWSKSHPDPDGKQVAALVPAFEALVQLCDMNGGEEATFGVLWDFASFPQRGYTAQPGRYTEHSAGDERFRELKPGFFDDRTDDELSRFRRGLKNLNKVYVHPRVTTLRVDTPIPDSVLNPLPYEKRGWVRAPLPIARPPRPPAPSRPRARPLCARPAVYLRDAHQRLGQG